MKVRNAECGMRDDRIALCVHGFAFGFDWQRPRSSSSHADGRAEYSAFRIPHSAFQYSAHTLVELVLGMVVMTVVMAGAGSAILLASRAMPGGDDTLARVPRGADALQRLTDELSCAIAFTKQLPTEVEFTVADRNGDAAEETIRYAWSGTAGGALIRQYNGGTAVEVAKDVHWLALTYNTNTQSETETIEDVVETDEILFATFDGWAGITPTPSDFPVSAAVWCSERFFVDQVTFPADASDIRITHVQVKMKAAGSGTNSTLGIHLPLSSGSTQPQAAPLGTPASLSSSLLGASYTWADFYFSDVPITGLPNEFVMVIKGANPSSANVRKLYSAVAPSDTPVMRWTSNSGGTWSPTKSSDLPKQDFSFMAYGRYKTTGTTEVTTNRYWLRSATVALQVGSDVPGRLQTEVQVLNAPEVTGP